MARGFTICMLATGCGDPDGSEATDALQDPPGVTEALGIQEPWPFRTCEGIVGRLEADDDPVLRIPLRVHVGHSDLSDDDVCGVMEEINQVWWRQARICFEMDLDRRVQPSRDLEKEPDVLNLWLMRDSSLFRSAQGANGVYIGGEIDEAYTVDVPNLGEAPNPADYLAARTGAHELGHALRLGHQNCGSRCDDLLMTSGRQGTALVSGSPASVDEIDVARQTAVTAARRALEDTGPDRCAPPRFIE